MKLISSLAIHSVILPARLAIIVFFMLCSAAALLGVGQPEPINGKPPKSVKCEVIREALPDALRTDDEYKPNFELSIKVYVPKSPVNSDIVARFIPIDRTKISLEDMMNINEVYFLYNLDIYVGQFNEPFNSDNKKPYAAKSEDDAIVVVIYHRRRDNDLLCLLYPAKRKAAIDDGKIEWLAHSNFATDIKAMESSPYDMRVSQLFYDASEYAYWFRIYEWPANDRLICGNN